MAARATPSGLEERPARTHSSRDLRGMFGALERLGYDVDALLASSGLHRSTVEDPDAYIPSSVCAGILAGAQRQRRTINLPLRLAVETPIGTNPLLDYLIVSSDSVGEGLRQLGRYLRIVNPAVDIHLDERENPIRVVVESHGDPFGVEFTIALSVIRFRQETDGELQVAHVSFSHEPEDAIEFARVLGCPIRARASWSGWAMSRAALDIPLRRRDPALRKWLERQAADILARHPIKQGPVFEVRRLLATRVPDDDARIETVARRLALTPRTLQRRLAEEGTSYEALRDATRRQAAETFLADPMLSIAEVACLLGYAEPTAFHRAFKRWHGTTPQAFRDRSRIDGGRAEAAPTKTAPRA